MHSLLLADLLSDRDLYSAFVKIGVVAFALGCAVGYRQLWVCRATESQLRKELRALRERADELKQARARADDSIAILSGVTADLREQLKARGKH